MSDAWRTASMDIRRPLSDYDRDAIRYMLEDRRAYAEIAAAIGRCLGTVKSEIYRIRHCECTGA